MNVLESNNYNDEFNHNSETSYNNLDDCINDHESMLIREFQRPQKRQCMLDPTPIVFGLIRTKKELIETQRLSRYYLILEDQVRLYDMTS